MVFAEDLQRFIAGRSSIVDKVSDQLLPGDQLPIPLFRDLDHGAAQLGLCQRVTRRT